MDPSIPSRPQSSYQRPPSAVRSSARRVVTRPASAVPGSTTQTIPSRPQTARPPPVRVLPYTIDDEGRQRPTAASIIADSMTTHFRPTVTATEMAFRDKDLQQLFNLYVGGMRGEDEEESKSTAATRRAAASARPASAKKQPPPSTMIGGVKQNVVLLRPKSARPVHRPAPPSQGISTVAGSHHQSSFGRTVYHPDSIRANIAPSTKPISLDEVDDDSGYPGIDEIPIPASVTIPHKATFRELGARFDDSQVHSWKHAAETRAVPLEADREQTALGKDISKAELERRRLIHLAKAHRIELDRREKPWRANDIYEKDARWSSKQHKDQVKELNRNLDDMLHTWRERQIESNRKRYETLPERQERRNMETGEIEAQIPQKKFEENDMLYRLMMNLENQMEELKVYSQIFASITRPPIEKNAAVGVGSNLAKGVGDHPQASTICPSSPLCDLLDRIRTAHESFYPQFSELFSEIKKRLKFDWILNEMSRRKDLRMEETTKELDAWKADLDKEQERSMQISSELERMKTTLISHTDKTFFDAPQAKATMLYDPLKRQLLHLETPEQVAALEQQPTMWYGEQEVDDEPEEIRGSALALAANKKKAEGGSSAGSIAWKNERAQRKVAKIAARLKIRNQTREEERRWRAGRMAVLRSKAKHAGMLDAEDQAVMRHLEEAEDRAKQLELLGDEKIEVSSSDDAGTDSEDETESGGGGGQAQTAASILARSKRLAAMSPADRAKKLYSRVNRAVVRAFTTRPLLHIRPLDSGAKVGGRVFCNSDYYSFELADTDPGVWIRLFATEAGSAENHIEMQLGYGAPPTRTRRFFVTTTQDGTTHCTIDLRNFEMRQAREERDKQMGRVATTSSGSHKTTPGRWYLRIVGRGFSMKSYALEFRIQTSLIDYSGMMAEALNDLELQSHWQSSLNHKTRILDQLAHELLTAKEEEQHIPPTSIVPSSGPTSTGIVSDASPSTDTPHTHQRRLSQVQLQESYEEFEDDY